MAHGFSIFPKFGDLDIIIDNVTNFIQQTNKQLYDSYRSLNSTLDFKLFRIVDDIGNLSDVIIVEKVLNINKYIHDMSEIEYLIIRDIAMKEYDQYSDEYCKIVCSFLTNNENLCGQLKIGITEYFDHVHASTQDEFKNFNNEIKEKLPKFIQPVKNLFQNCFSVVDQQYQRLLM